MRSQRIHFGDFLKGLVTFIGLLLLAFASAHHTDLAGNLALIIIVTIAAWLGWESAGDAAWLRGAFFGTGLCTPFLIFFVLLSRVKNIPPNPWVWLEIGLGFIIAIGAAQVASFIRTRHTIAALTIFIYAGALICASWKSFPKLLRMQHAQRIASLTNRPLPSLQLTDLRGTTIPDSELSGHVTVIDFWGTWCVACIAELPDVQAVAQDYAADNRVKFLLINSEISGDNSAKISRFAERRHLSLPIALDPSQSFYKLGLSALPQTLIVDRNAHIRFIDSGFASGAMHQRLHSQIDSLLGSN